MLCRCGGDGYESMEHAPIRARSLAEIERLERQRAAMAAHAYGYRELVRLGIYLRERKRGETEP